ncbi:MAG: TonB-dependent receptor [Bacteroidetes bacterium]|nr:TonB-dependent receptor [Bacteroidota bacterium]
MIKNIYQSLKIGIFKAKKFYFLVLLIIISSLSYAQQAPISNSTISGIITNKKTNKPLIGAYICINGSQKGAITNEKGAYSIKTSPGKYTLVLSYIGYKKVTTDITLEKESVTKNFKMKENAFSLNDVVINGKRENEKIIKEIKESPMAVSVINGKKMMGRSSGIGEILSRASGLTIRREGGLGGKSRVSVHGLEGKRVAIFIDGFALNSPDGSFDINDLPVDVIERIEIYKGIVPAEYGGDGLGGAINIVTREVNCDMISAIAEIGSYGNFRFIGSGKKLFEKPGIQMSLAFLHNRANNNYSMDLRAFDPDYPIEPYSHVIRNNDKYHSSILNGSLTFTKLWFDKIELEFTGYENYKELQDISFDSRYSHSHGTNLMPNIKLEKENFFLKGLDFKASMVYAMVNTHLVDTVGNFHQWTGKISPSQGETLDHIFNLSDDWTRELRGKINLKYKINENHYLNLNNQFVFSKKTPKDDYIKEYIGFDPSGFPSKMTGNITGFTYSFFSKNKRFQNTLALKTYYLNSQVYRTEDKKYKDTCVKKTPDQTTNNDLYFGYNEGFSYKLIKGLRIKTSFEHTLRLPDPEELFGDGINIKSSTNLKPEKSDNVNLGLLFDKTDFLGLTRVQAEVNGFYMNTSNLIRLVPADTRLAYSNLGKTKIYGVDLDLKIDITRNWYVYFNVTFQSLRDNLKWKTKDKKVENPTYKLDIPNTPSFYYNYGLEYHRSNWPIKDELSRIYVDASYVGEYCNAWKLTSQKSQKTKWTIPAYHNYSIGIQQSFLKNEMSLCLAVNNIFNATIYNDYKMPLPGRTFSIKLRYNWFRDKSERGAMQL